MLQRVDAEEQPVRRAEEAPGGKDFGVYGETLVGGRKDLQGRVVQPRAQEGLQPFRGQQPALRHEIACAAGAPQVVRDRDGYIERVFLQGEFLVELHNAVFYKAFRDRRVGIGDLFAAFRCQADDERFVRRQLQLLHQVVAAGLFDGFPLFVYRLTQRVLAL